MRTIRLCTIALRSILMASLELGSVACGASSTRDNPAPPTPDPADAPARVPAVEPSLEESSGSTMEQLAAQQPASSSPTAAEEQAGREESSSGSVDLESRAMYELLLRLSSDPGARATSAPDVRSLFHSEEDVEEPIEDLTGRLSWLRGARYRSSWDDGLEDRDDDGDSETVDVLCDASQRMCRAYQPGGVTTFHFERRDGRLELKLVESEAP